MKRSHARAIRYGVILGKQHRAQDGLPNPHPLTPHQQALLGGDLLPNTRLEEDALWRTYQGPQNDWITQLPDVPEPRTIKRVPDADHEKWATEDGHPEDGRQVVVLAGCNAGKRGRVVKHDFRQVFVQCEPEGVGWYSGNELDPAPKAGHA